MSMLWIQEDWDEEVRTQRDKEERIRFLSCQMSTINDNRKEILRAAPTLAPFQPNPQNPLCLVSEFFGKRVPGTLIWKLQVQYSTEVDVAKNPLAAPAVITCDSAERTRVALVDVNGDPILNAAGDPFYEPPVEDEDEDLVFKVKRNLPINWPSWLKQYRRSTNSDSVRLKGETYDPGTLAFKGLSIGEDQLINGVDFIEVNFELHLRDEGWTKIVPNMGYYQLKKRQTIVAAADQGTSAAQQLIRANKNKYDRIRIKVKDDNGAMVYASTPQPLDKNGALVVPKSKDGILQPSDIVLLEFNLKRQLPYSVLPLK